MERANSFWQINGKYNDVKEFHFSSQLMSFTAFFKDDQIIFVIDDTCDVISPNELLIIEPLEGEQNPKKPETKWDSILKNKFGINPMEIRPKENTKYKKLDISYASLDLYASFASLQTEELLTLIEQNREILSLENAYEREAENLLIYNKSTTTLEKAQLTLEKLKKRILTISKKMKKQEEKEQLNPENIDEEAKAELIQKLYLATEKLKRTERRIKRANKRSEVAYNELSAKRQQIAEIKRRIGEENQNMETQAKVVEENEPKYMPLPTQEQSSIEQEIPPETSPKINEKLTIENNNATNLVEEKKEQTFLTKESAIMAKETENKKVQETQEFKPPYVDDTAMEQPSTDIRFAKKTNILLDDKYKKIWMYSISVLVSLIVVFGIFYFISGDSSTPVNEDVYNTNYIEQNYFPEEQKEQEPTPVVEEVVEPVEVIEVTETPAPVVEEPVKKKEVVAPAPVAKPVKKVAPAKKTPVSAPVVKKEEVKPAPVKQEATSPVVEEEEELIVEDDFDDEEDYIDEEEYLDDEGDIIEEEEEVEVEEELSPLEEARKNFYDNVIDNDAYITLIDEITSNYFENDTNVVSLLEKLNEMNGYWNTFRNISYDAYYEGDYTLKPDINYEEYADDEYLLRLYTNKYFDMYEYLVNEFVMTYEYANGTASDLYPVMENEMQILGKPNAKLQILVELYNAIQRAGGVNAVLKGIAVKYEEDLKYAPEIEATLIPLEETTTVIVNDETIYDNGSSSTTYYTEEEYDDDLLVNSENSLEEEEVAEEDDYSEDDEEYVEEDISDEYDNPISANTEAVTFVEDDMETVEVMPISENIKTFENTSYEEEFDDEEEVAEDDGEDYTDDTEDDEYAVEDVEEDEEYAEEDDEYYDDEDEDTEYSETNESYEEELI
ncbi:MAG: hypothetical protein ACI4N3_02590 [Alphaproteobacteria bacterium]